MSYIEKEKYWLEFLSCSQDRKHMIDIINILKYMSSSQYNSLKQIALNILTGKIPLTTSQYNKLSSHKLFIRKLARSRVSKTFISTKSKVIYTLVNIALKHNAACSKVSTSKNRRLVKKKRQQYEGSETSDSEYSSTSESSNISSESSNISSSNTSARIRESFSEKSEGEEIEDDNSFFNSKEEKEGFNNDETY